ncbi:unnamed protein product [Brachionus calyciflorus]|uniref:SWIM-type domain-containing protein n=1 Tax=Brachionus calyciflorus TaxID=104777 RepID=A0A814BZD4_9BILA|nr:unnamed protein product [Brachionus calyciflorus]
MTSYFKKKSVKDFKNSKLFWKFYSTSVKTKNSDTNTNFPDFLIENGNEIPKQSDMPNVFNSHFSNVKPTKIEPNDCLKFVDKIFTKLKRSKKVTSPGFSFKLFSKPDVENAIKELSQTSSPGVSGIPTLILKERFLQKELENKSNQIKTRVSRTCNSVRVNELILQLADRASDLILNQYQSMTKMNYKIYRVGVRDFNIESPNGVYLVTVDNENFAKCGCDFTTNFMLPCRHTMFVCEFNVMLKPWFHKRFLKIPFSKDYNSLT